MKSKYPGNILYRVVILQLFSPHFGPRASFSGGITHIKATLRMGWAPLWNIFMNQPLNRNVPPQHWLFILLTVLVHLNRSSVAKYRTLARWMEKQCRKTCELGLFLLHRITRAHKV